MKGLILPVVFLLFSQILSAQHPVGIFHHHAGVGKPKLSGQASFDSASQHYTLRGAGYNVWFGRDEFQYLYKNLRGDFILTANFEFAGAGGDPHRKIGWMVRPDTSDNARHVSAVSHGDGLTLLQWRACRAR